VLTATSLNPLNRGLQPASAERQRRVDTIVQDARAPAITMSGVRAVEKCNPIALPRDKYDAWRDLELNLYPKYATNG
jgi:hypothetical protein